MLHVLKSPISREDIAELARRESLVLDDPDRIAVLQSANSIDIQACPGSGKTTLIAAKLILLAMKWQAADKGICVLSHTNVAKDEIISRLTKSTTVEARRLFGYPHFIGTIQDFVDRYLALPLLRTRGLSNIIVNNDEYARIARKILNWNSFTWLRCTMNSLGKDEDQESFLRSTYRTISENGSEDINIIRRAKAWKQDNNFARARGELLKLKRALHERGVFLFRDMYSYAQTAISMNGSLPRILAARFPFVFIDEVQDTQRFQEEILCQLFPTTDTRTIVQRFGDPDQAIFHGIGNEDPNQTFNGKAAMEMDFVIHNSHRFDNTIAEKIKGMSYNEVSLCSELDDAAVSKRNGLHRFGKAFEHTVIVFDDSTRQSVVKQFAKIVSSQFNTTYQSSREFCVKALGAVGNEIDPTVDQLKLGHYWTPYDKHSVAGNLKPNSLIHAVRYCRRNSSIDWIDNYKTLIACVLRFLRLAGIQDHGSRHFSERSLRDFLERKGKWQKLRETFFVLLSESYLLDEEGWTLIVSLLSAIFELKSVPDEAREYLCFESEEQPRVIQQVADVESDLTAVPGNRAVHRTGFMIQLSTIHAVKGETHDATLVVETKNYCFDLGAMLQYLTGVSPSREIPNRKLGEKARSKKANKQFMRQLYVAMSRPKHLLCLAIHSDRFSCDDARRLQERGWKINRLPSNR